MKRIQTFLLALLCLTSCIKEKQTGVDLSIGDRIPDFDVMMNDGTVVSGAQLSKGICCIVFFTTGCNDCKATLPHIQNLYDDYASQGVEFVLISREDDAVSVGRHWSQQGYTMPFSAQSDRHIYELFARTRVPRVYICEDGIVRHIFTDSPIPTYVDLKDAIDLMLGLSVAESCDGKFY